MTNPAPQDVVPLPWILAVLLRDRRVILACAAAGLVLAVIIGLAKRPSYTSSFSFLPQSTQDQTRGGLASLAGQFGIPLGMLGGGQQQPPQLYADLLETREVLSALADDTVLVDRTERRALAEFLGVSGSDTAVVREETVRALREKVIRSSVATRTTGAVTVFVTTRSPHVSVGIAQQLLEGLNQFNRVTRQSQAGEERRFTEGRLAAAQAALRDAEDALQRFLQANRSFTNAPQLTFQQERLQREVTLRQQVVVGLAQQYEDARIREVRDTPVITVLERPMLPVLPDPRGRVRLVLVLTFGFGFLGLLGVLARAAWQRQRAGNERDPSYAMLSNEWAQLRRKIKTS